MKLKLFRGVTDFFKDIVNSVKSGSVIGIDFGTASIKVVEVARRGDRFVLVNYGILETRDYLRHTHLSLQTSSLDIVVDEASRLLSLLAAEMKLKSAVALAAVPLFTSFFTLLDIPVLSERETAQVVQYQAQKYIPMPVNDVKVDWLKVDSYTNEQGNEFQRLALMGIPKKLIANYGRICASAGLSVQTMELDALALARAVASHGKPTLVMDIGAESTTMLVCENGILKQARQSDYGGVHITRAVSNGLGLGMARAELLKKQKGILGDIGSAELVSLLTPFLDVIIQEAEYTRSTYERRYGRNVEQFTILGGGGNLAGTPEHISEQLKLPYVKTGVLDDVDYAPQLESAADALGRELAVAIGTAKRYFYV